MLIKQQHWHDLQHGNITTTPKATLNIQTSLTPPPLYLSLREQYMSYFSLLTGKLSPFYINKLVLHFKRCNTVQTEKTIALFNHSGISDFTLRGFPRGSFSMGLTLKLMAPIIILTPLFTCTLSLYIYFVSSPLCYSLRQVRNKFMHAKINTRKLWHHRHRNIIPLTTILRRRIVVILLEFNKKFRRISK